MTPRIELIVDVAVAHEDVVRDAGDRFAAAASSLAIVSQQLAVRNREFSAPRRLTPGRGSVLVSVDVRPYALQDPLFPHDRRPMVR